MFSMFYFLSLFIQLVMGYSPLHAGFAFLPFSFGIVIGAGVSSNLVNRIDARYIAGIGTLMAAVALVGFSRLSVPDSPSAVAAAIQQGNFLGDGVNYWSSIFPYILLMSIGMGAVFVPLTLTAVHHLRAEDSGIGSGVLNTMQQVGGALGLAILSTVALSAASDKKSELAGALAAQGVPGDQIGLFAYLGSFTDGATAAFLVGAGLITLGSLVDLALPQREARGAGDRRPRGRSGPRRLTDPAASSTAPPETPRAGRRHFRPGRPRWPR